MFFKNPNSKVYNAEITFTELQQMLLHSSLTILLQDRMIQSKQTLSIQIIFLILCKTLYIGRIQI